MAPNVTAHKMTHKPAERALNIYYHYKRHSSLKNSTRHLLLRPSLNVAARRPTR